MHLHHGGRLRHASVRYGIPVAQWLDFSTAINPQAWPVPTLPADVWQRLPEDNDELNAAAQAYYGRDNLLAVPGTQAVIETLPRLLSQRRVWVPNIGYREHAYCWQKHGHVLQSYTNLPNADDIAPQDVVVVINPNNPTGQRHENAALLALADHLAHQQGFLVVDEAFMDCTPEHSLLQHALPDSVLVLRSFGKFFGLAGIRLGFCFATPYWLDALNNALGPWAVNHPARWIATQALLDTPWQKNARHQLQQARCIMQEALAAILGEQATLMATDLFITLHMEAVTNLHEHLARQGLFTRLFSDENLLRLGVDADAQHQARLMDGVRSFQG